GLPRPRGRADADLGFIPRPEMDIAVVGAGVSLTIDGGGTITAARVSLGAVAPRVLLVREAATAIVGSRLEREAQDRLEAAARAVCAPIDDRRGTGGFRIPGAGGVGPRGALITLGPAGEGRWDRPTSRRGGRATRSSFFARRRRPCSTSSGTRSI